MIQQNISAVRERISLICGREKKDYSSVRIVAVSKGRSVEEISRVLSAGICDIGENRVQEASEKHALLQRISPAMIRWHMVGHLQSNKAREAVRIFDLIHSIDSLKLAAEINRHAQAAGKVQQVLVQVNISGEGTKSGLSPLEAAGAVKEMLSMQNIMVKGLMTIAPHFFSQEKAGPFFAGLRGLMEEFNYLLPDVRRLELLSMGMSEDFEAALCEGSNMLRLGRIIFDGTNHLASGAG
ncbi:MAG: YggS family pyridoxal phosphate-dependent enzyme [Candidatus Omnitrophota bacterium]